MDIFTRIPIDKQAHALGGAVIALTLGYIFPPLWGFAAAIIAGVLKEIWDYFYPETHTCDVWDFVATAGGGLVGSLFVFLIHY